MDWKGVIPAITTPFKSDLSIDHEFLERHANWLIDNGCTGIVVLGSLGEGATLSFEEKLEVIGSCVGAIGDRAPVAAAISGLSTGDAVRLSNAAVRGGCNGLMVLPPYAYSTDWREMKRHVTTVLEATEVSCMLYNNPIAYTTDFFPNQIAELAREYSNLHAVKESSTDVRRISWLKSDLGDRLSISVGVDDLIVEGIQAGARGWIAGLVNALPSESVALFNWTLNGELTKARELLRWFLPLLRLDTVPKLVQLIKLAQAEVGMGSVHVRPPRLELDPAELSDALKIIRSALDSRPKI